MKTRFVLGLVAGCLLATLAVPAQQTPELAVFEGLAPTSTLLKTDTGRAALAANLNVTGGIQTGTLAQSALLPFPEQQQQALRDASSTYSNLSQLADGLGTALGSAYVARAHQIDRDHATALSPEFTALIAFAASTSGWHSNAAKFFFANLTTDGRTPVSDAAKAILEKSGGTTDVFGKAYNLPAGSPSANPFGNSRPYQTEPAFLRFSGADLYNAPSDNTVYTRGPAMELNDSPSFPSGHTTYGYTGAVLLAILVPDRYQQMIARGAEYGNSRIVIGAHYAMDVLGGRTLALYDMAHLLANDPDYVNQKVRHAPAIGDFRAALEKARAQLNAVLAAGCGKTVPECAREDISRFSSPAADEAFYASTQTYNLPVVFPKNAAQLEDVSKLAPEAGYLLTAAFPKLTLEEANRILTETEGPGGGFLDSGTAFGVYSRLNLYAAAGRAAQLAAAR